MKGDSISQHSKPFVNRRLRRKGREIRALPETTRDDVSKPSQADRPAVKLPEYDTAALFGSAREIVINHAGSAYRMKITKQGKLILNK